MKAIVIPVAVRVQVRLLIVDLKRIPVHRVPIVVLRVLVRALVVKVDVVVQIGVIVQIVVLVVAQEEVVNQVEALVRAVLAELPAQAELPVLAEVPVLAEAVAQALVLAEAVIVPEAVPAEALFPANQQKVAHPQVAQEVVAVVAIAEAPLPVLPKEEAAQEDKPIPLLLICHCSSAVGELDFGILPTRLFRALPISWKSGRIQSAPILFNS